MIVTLPWPPASLSPNARPGHWAVRAKAVKGARLAARMDAARAMNWGPKLKAPVNVTITLTPPRRGTNADNDIGRTKALSDGVADAIGVPDEQWAVTYVHAEPKKPGSVTFNIEAA